MAAAMTTIPVCGRLRYLAAAGTEGGEHNG
jgi:hypothetical protein